MSAFEPQRHRGRVGLVFVLAMISWMPSCYEPGEGNSSPLILGPGDGLLDHVAALEVVRTAHTNLSPAVRAAVDQTLARPERAIPASAWLAGGTVDPAVVASLGLPVQGALRRFRCRPSLRPDLGLGRVWLRHDGRVLLPSQGEVGDRRLWWMDMPGLLVFRWDAEQGVLLAFGLATPGEVVIGFDVTSPVDLLHWEGTGTDVPVARRFGLDELDRPALPVTTPSVMQWSLQGISAQTLDVAVAVLDVGLVMSDDGRLVRQSGHGDGVTFAVELVAGGETTRLWERHVTNTAAWTEERVRLPEAVQGPVVLRLVTEPGPAGNSLYDHALWAGLRLRGATDQRDPRPHLLVIDLDTLRADRLGCYGAARNATPRIDAWAASSAQIFDNATSVESWTLPSTVSMLTGLAVSQHGVRDHHRRMTADMQPVAARLAAAGYETHARTDSGYVIPAMGFSEGFDIFNHKPLQADQDWSGVLDRLTERDSPAPVFCFLQTYWPHEPYAPDGRFADPSRPYTGPLAGDLLTVSSFHGAKHRSGAVLDSEDRRYVNALYDAAVFRTDALVGDFLDGLAEVFGDEPYLVLLTSDHGQELFERGAFGHGLGLHTEQLRVPLIVRHVGAARVGRSAAPVTGLDLVPTLLDAAGLSVPQHLPGRSLLRPLPEEAPQVAWHRGRDVMLQFSGFKMISTGADASLFDLAADPDERDDVSGSQPQQVERMRTLLGTWLERWPPIATGDDGLAILSAEDRATLEALGYLR